MVRAAIARTQGAPQTEPNPVRDFAANASFAKLPLVRSGDECLIEPSVSCNHCGYCLSYGH